jgi:ribosomal protein S12 methylthiotransferase accessory factor
MKEFRLTNVLPSDTQETLNRMGVLVDPLCGVVRSVMPNLAEQGDARIYTFGAIGCQASPLSIEPQLVHAGGAATNEDQALVATIGEAVERYCSAYCDPDDLVYGSYQDFRDDAVHPAQFGLYSDRQYADPEFPFRRFTEQTRLSWTWGYSLQHEKPRLIPALLTYFPFYAEGRQSEPEIALVTSTGLACGNTIEEAILSGLRETVERDSIACFWLNRLTPPAVLIDESSALYKVFIEDFALEGLRYYICEITTDLRIPTYLTLLVGGSNYGLMVNAGSAASLSPTTAVKKSLVEAASGRPYVRFILQSESAWKYRSDFSSVNTFRDHAAFYTREPQHHNALAFLTAERAPDELSAATDLTGGSILGDLKICLDLLAEHGLDVIVKDLTSPDIEDVGLKVARVLIPGLQQLHGDHRYPYLGCSRLYRAPKALGMSAELTTEADLNPYPHPLP